MVLPAQLNPPQFAIPFQQVPLAVVPAAEGIASSLHLSLEEEIENFQFAEKERTPKRPVEILDFKTESDKLSIAHQSGHLLLSLKQALGKQRSWTLRRGRA